MRERLALQEVERFTHQHINDAVGLAQTGEIHATTPLEEELHILRQAIELHFREPYMVLFTPLLEAFPVGLLHMDYVVPGACENTP